MNSNKKMDGKMITIYDIAKEANVSTSTVSRVLTNNANVKPEKKEKILELINKYNYKPNALARGLTDTKRKVIGIITADVRNPFYAEIFIACEQAARELGYTVILCNSLGEQEIEELQLEKLEEQRVDAVILIGGRVDDLQSNEQFVETVNRVQNSIPVILTGKLDGTDCYQVRINAIKSMDLIMEYLISLNHTEIAIIGGRKNVISTYEKIQRYKQLTAKYQIPFRAEYIQGNGGYDYQDGYASMNRLLLQRLRPTAIIAINDFIASGAICSINEHGYKIPDDISVISYDNTYISQLTLPKLTSVDYNYKLFGTKLIETSIAAIEEQKVERLQFVEPILVKRDSCKENKQDRLVHPFTSHK